MISINGDPLFAVITRESRGPNEHLPAAVPPSLHPPQLAIPQNEAELREVTIESLTLIGLDVRVPGYLFAAGFVRLGDVLDKTPGQLRQATGHASGFGGKMQQSLIDAVNAIQLVAKALRALSKSIGPLRKTDRFVIQSPLSILESQC